MYAVLYYLVVCGFGLGEHKTAKKIGKYHAAAGGIQM
jgi:hypothetical protein